MGLLLDDAASRLADSPADIDIAFTMSALQVGGQAMPDITGDVSYDTETRQFTIHHFLASSDGNAPEGGGLNPDAEVTIAEGGTIGLPRKTADGVVLEPGKIQLHIDARNLDPGDIAHWFPQGNAQRLGGEMDVQVDTLPQCTTSEPLFQAAIDIHAKDGHDPTAFGIPFQSARAMVTLETDPDDPSHTLQRLVVSGADHGADMATMLLEQAGTQTLDFGGFLPLRWSAPLHPTFPADQPFHLQLSLPAQGLLSTKSYLAAFFPALAIRMV